MGLTWSTGSKGSTWSNMTRSKRIDSVSVSLRYSFVIKVEIPRDFLTAEHNPGECAPVPFKSLSLLEKLCENKQTRFGLKRCVFCTKKSRVIPTVLIMGYTSTSTRLLPYSCFVLRFNLYYSVVYVCFNSHNKSIPTSLYKVTYIV